MKSLYAEISVSLKDFELKDVKIELERGETLAILGHTGSGKSVLIEAIAGFYPCSGRVILNGRDLTRLPPEKRCAGIVYQDFVLFPRMSVYDNIAYGARKRVKRESEIREKILEVSEIMHIEHLLDRNPESLSGGEKQRVAIARALVAEPELLLMDEPFSALDPVTREELRELVRNAVRELGISVILATHDLDDVFSLADSVCILLRRGKESRVVQYGKLWDVFSRPKREVSEFCGINYFTGKVVDVCGEKCVVDIGAFKLCSFVNQENTGELKAGDRVAVCIAPENFRVTGVTENYGGCEENLIECEVLEVCRNSRLLWIKAKKDSCIIRCCVTPAFAPDFLSEFDLKRWNKRGDGKRNGKRKCKLAVKPENVFVYRL